MSNSSFSNFSPNDSPNSGSYCSKSPGISAQTETKYQPIENYGVIGNMHTVALISRHGASIDFFCYPDFDSPTVFARLLDCAKGGFFEIAPSSCKSYYTRIPATLINPSTPYKSIFFSDSPFACRLGGLRIRTKQLYLPSSNVLVTRFSGNEGISQVTDLMPLDESGAKVEPSIIRKLECIRGSVVIDVRICPAFDYARSGHKLNICYNHSKIYFSSRFLSIEIQWTPQFTLKGTFGYDGTCTCSSSFDPSQLSFWKLEGNDDRPGVVGTFSLVEGQSVMLTLRGVKIEDIAPDTESSTNIRPIEQVYLDRYNYLSSLIGATINFWHTWLARCTYKGRWRENVHRSALILKLLTYAPTGAIIAAPTFGLPEEIGGLLNWDYRFTWIRDAAFTVYAFLRIGFKEEALQFMQFIEERCRQIGKPGYPESLQVLYDIRGNSPATMIQDVQSRSEWYIDIEANSNSPASIAVSTLEALYLSDNEYEMTLSHLDGYCSSRPVRIGNAACNQSQTDIYGELLDAIYLVDKLARPVSYDFWCFIRHTLLPKVLESIPAPDHGIWELRHGQRHYTYSKIMSWVALDRAIRLAAKHSFPSDADSKWRPARDALFEEIMEKSWSEERKAFVQYYGSTDLDASSLVMPLVLFLSPLDPKFLSTLNETLKPPRLGGLTANNLCFRWSPWVPSETPSSMMVMVPSDSSGKLHSTSQFTINSESSVTTQGSMLILRNEGTFNLCSFWLVEAMARAGSRSLLENRCFLDNAVLKFEDIIGYANHLGLFSEEISVNGEALGNFPQAFTHLALISAAFNIDRYLEDQ